MSRVNKTTINELYNDLVDAKSKQSKVLFEFKDNNSCLIESKYMRLLFLLKEYTKISEKKRRRSSKYKRNSK